MKTSEAGRKVLHDREGVRLTAYKDTVGVWTIGYGHTSSAGPPKVVQGMKITQAEAEEIFARDLKTFETGVEKALKRTPAQHHFDGYTSFAYNVGVPGMSGSTSVKLYNQGDVDGAARALMNWQKPPEIASRRRGESAQMRNNVVKARMDSAEYNRLMAQPVYVGETAVSTVICVDLSHYQAGFDFSAFKGAGGLGVICKATEGMSIKDASYKTFRQQALGVGLVFASYHFFRSSDPTAQANYYLSFAQPVEGERVVVDFEDDNTTVADMTTFLQTIQLLDPTLQLTVYSGHTIKDKLGSNANDWLAQNTSLWLAQYTTGTPSWPKQVWPQYSLWQYSDNGSVPGFKGAVDCNRFNGPDANFLKWMGPAEQPAPGQEPGPEPEDVAEITVALSADRPVNISVTAGENVTLVGAARA